MSNPVSIRVQGPVAVLSMDRPPVNSLGYDLRVGIADALDEANANPAVQAIVLIGTARAFSAGADVTEFGTPKGAKEPNLPCRLMAWRAGRARRNRARAQIPARQPGLHGGRRR